MRVDVLDFLKGIRRKRGELDAIELSMEGIRRALLPGGVRYDIDKVQTSPHDKMPEIMAKLSVLKEKETYRMTELLSDIDLAIDLINQLPTPEHRQLLRLRYIIPEVLTWEQIAKQMGYSVDHVKGYMHGRAVMEAREVWKALKD